MTRYQLAMDIARQEEADARYRRAVRLIIISWRRCYESKRLLKP